MGIHADGSKNSDHHDTIVAVLEKTFSQTRFKSFLRQLQIYGFERKYNGVRRGECKHHLLVRGQRHLLDQKSVKHFNTPMMEEVITTTTSSFASTSQSTPQSPTAAPIVSSSSQFEFPYTRMSKIPCRLVNLVHPESYRNSSMISSISSIGDNDSDSYSGND